MTEQPPLDKEFKVVLVDFFPLPQNYPYGMSPFIYAFSGEAYEEPKKDLRVFVPKDYQNIIRAAFQIAFLYGKVDLAISQTVTDAVLLKPKFIITGAVKDFKVIDDYHQETPIDHRWKAIVSFLIEVIDGETLKPVLSTEIGHTFEHNKLPIALPLHLKSSGLVFQDINEYTYHPLRVLLMYATHNCASDLLGRLADLCS